jgi:outer membrane cobalamin receptor
VLLAALLPAVAGAQVRDTTRADSAAVPLPPVVVTASRLPVRADRVGFAFTVVDAAALDRARPRFVAELLRALPGSFVDEAAGPGGPTIVRLRGGEEVFTQVLVDGVRVNQNGGFFDLQGLTLSNLERVEIARGPQSALYGSSAVSGVVHFLTRRGEPGQSRVSVLAEGGQAVDEGGGYRGTVEVSGGSERLQYAAGAGGSFERGIYALPHDTRTLDGSLRLDWLPAERWSITGTLRGIGMESNLPVRDPGATRVPLDPNARNQRDRLVGAIDARFAPATHWTQRLRVATYREDFVFEDERDDVATEVSVPFFIFDADFTLDSELRRSTVEYSGSWDARGGARGIGVAWGALLENESLAEQTAGDFGDNSQELDRSSTAAFAELLVTPAPRVDLLFGARAEKFEGLATEVTPRASAVVDAVPGVLSLRAAAGRAYKAPNLQEQYLDNPFIKSNPDLEPERSTSWEVGADLRGARGRVAASLTYFHQTFENLIRTVALEGTSQQINRNLGESLAQGVEWELRVRPGPRWEVGTEGAWIGTEIRENTGLSPDAFPIGEELPFRPSIVAGAFVDVQPVDGVSARVRGLRVGSQTVLTERFSGDRVELEPYFLAGLDVAWAATPRVELYGRADNLFDVRYETAFDRTGIPLGVAVGVRFRN